jgi:hypothetical protein
MFDPKLFDENKFYTCSQCLQEKIGSEFYGPHGCIMNECQACEDKNLQDYIDNENKLIAEAKEKKIHYYSCDLEYFFESDEICEICNLQKSHLEVNGKKENIFRLPRADHWVMIEPPCKGSK